MSPLLFYPLAALTLAGALGVVVARNPVRGAMSLVATLFLVARPRAAPGPGPSGRGIKGWRSATEVWSTSAKVEGPGPGPLRGRLAGR